MEACRSAIRSGTKPARAETAIGIADVCEPCGVSASGILLELCPEV
jgi:hypothetical protein